MKHKAIDPSKLYHAAPEMYEALKDARETLVRLLNEQDSTWVTQFDGGAHQVESIDAVIAKVEKPR